MTPVSFVGDWRNGKVVFVKGWRGGLDCLGWMKTMGHGGSIWWDCWCPRRRWFLEYDSVGLDPWVTDVLLLGVAPSCIICICLTRTLAGATLSPIAVPVRPAP